MFAEVKVYCVPTPHTVQRESQEEAGPNFFFDLDSAHRKQKKQQDGGPPAKRRPPPQPRGPCWFCLGGKGGGETSRGLHQRSCEIECVVLANTAHTKYNVAHK